MSLLKLIQKFLHYQKPLAKVSQETGKQGVFLLRILIQANSVLRASPSKQILIDSSLKIEALQQQSHMTL